MTETSIALAGILVGILGANLAGLLFKKSTFQLTGNSILGVFGSVLLIKSLGRLGFDPVSIMQTGELNTLLWIFHLVVSLTGGFCAVLMAKKILTKFK